MIWNKIKYSSASQIITNKHNKTYYNVNWSLLIGI